MNRARWDLCGGRSVMGVPTAIARRRAWGAGAVDPGRAIGPAVAAARLQVRADDGVDAVSPELAAELTAMTLVGGCGCTRHTVAGRQSFRIT